MRWLVLFFACTVMTAQAEDGQSWLGQAWDGAKDIWATGQHEIYAPFVTHHLRFAYTREKIDSYEERPAGLGYGRGKYRSNGDWHGLYAMGFQDSHHKPSYMAGYAYQTFWRPAQDLRLGAGFTAFVMTREDIGHYTPFPGILPIASIGFEKFALETAYVPGGKGNGNILFIWGKISFDR